MNVALVGYRGCGKSTIGHRLADKLWLKFVDVDGLIVKKAGKSIKALFEEDGEPYFRAVETEVVRDCVKSKDIILSLGGGTVITEENRTLVKAWADKVIYLRCEADELLKRIQSDPQSAETRPALTKFGGGIDEIKTRLSTLEPLYREVMSAELDVTYLNPPDACVYIARLL